MKNPDGGGSDRREACSCSACSLLSSWSPSRVRDSHIFPLLWSGESLHKLTLFILMKQSAIYVSKAEHALQAGLFWYLIHCSQFLPSFHSGPLHTSYFTFSRDSISLPGSTRLSFLLHIEHRNPRLPSQAPFSHCTHVWLLLLSFPLVF